VTPKRQESVENDAPVSGQTEHELQPEEIRRQFGPFDQRLRIEEAWTPPASWYTSPQFFQLEKRYLWQRNWVYAAPSHLVELPGSYTTGNFIGEPYIITRGEDGVLRAFYNVCRHHANLLMSDIPSEKTRYTELVQERGGQAQEFVCCYHGWKYSLQGKLLKATRLKGIENFKPKDFGLYEIPLVQWGPFIFLHFGPSGSYEKKAGITIPNLPDLHAELEPLDKILKENFPDISKMKYVGSKSWVLNCNWKVYIDNYLDGEYHIPTVHPGLNNNLSMDTYTTFLYNLYSIQFSRTQKKGKNAKDIKIGEDFDERVGEVAVYAMLHPNFGINRYGDMMDTNWIVPISHDKCEIKYDFYFEEHRTKDPDYIAKSIVACSNVQEEDGGICHNLQKGLSSSGYNRGRYAPTVEHGTYHFHRFLARSIGLSH